jgi:crotonobetainyl-CoA:carnitine CoA-transferase CaiB-like acyl-CoA transferase
VSFRPLKGVRVLDLTTSLAGPTCTSVLGALGADVVKVEPVGGDEARAWGPPFEDGVGVLFLSANASKRSLALSLSDSESLEAVRRVAERAQVVVQSLRPGLAVERGLDAGALRARNLELVHVSISAFGSVGPLAGRPGYDPLVQAASGIISVTGEAGGPGARVGVSLVDLTTGVWAALGAVSALGAGGGHTIEVSLYETALSLMSYHLRAYEASGVVPRRHGTAFPLIAPYEAFATADGEVMIAVGNDGLWQRLRTVLDLDDDPRFATNPQRVAHRAALSELLSARFRADTTAAWVERLTTAGVPAAPVADVAQVAAAEQTLALGMLAGLGGLPLSVGGDRVSHRSPPPALGAHTREILRDVGYEDAAVDALVARGVAASA